MAQNNALHVMVSCPKKLKGNQRPNDKLYKSIHNDKSNDNIYVYISVISQEPCIVDM